MCTTSLLSAKNADAELSCYLVSLSVSSHVKLSRKSSKKFSSDTKFTYYPYFKDKQAGGSVGCTED